MSSKQGRPPTEGRTPASGRRAAVRPVITDLETSVASAVRTAIAGTLARHAQGPDLPRIDMDFAQESASVAPRPANDRSSVVVTVVLVGLLGAAAAPALWPRLTPWLPRLVDAGHGLPDEPARQPNAERRLSVIAGSLAPEIVVRVAPPAATLARPLHPSEPPPASTALPAATAASAPSIVAEAQAMLGRGDVLAARGLLRAPAVRREIEALLTLARSYDPNFLASLARADAAADAAEAERLYRDWFALAVEAGLVSGEVQLDRLLRSLKTSSQ